MANGVDVGVSSGEKPAPDTFPTLAKCGANYMNSQLAKLEAIDHGYEEAIMLDYEGHVSEGSGENIFIIEDGVLYTPSMDSSNLKGITRESIKQLANDLGYEVVEERISRERLYLLMKYFSAELLLKLLLSVQLIIKSLVQVKEVQFQKNYKKLSLTLLKAKKKINLAGWITFKWCEKWI